MGLSESLFEVINKDAFLFTNKSGDSFARIKASNHVTTVAIRSELFRFWLGQSCYDLTGSYPTENVMRESIVYAEGKSRADGIVREVFCRLAGDHQKILIDLIDESGSHVEITADGWTVVDQPPSEIFFIRRSSMLEIPRPQRNGNLADLRGLLNLNNETDWKLLVIWILGALNPKGPYPILMLNGGPGTAKSTTSSILKRLIDPSGAPLRSLPTNERDAMVMGQSARVLVFDNVSHMSNEISDLFCRIATGAGFAVRKLYTDSEEKVISVMLASIFNGIPDFYSSRSDLVDRSVGITLKKISSVDRKSSKELEASFEQKRGQIFGALLDVLVSILRNLPFVKMKNRPRMADFAEFVTAAEKHLDWEEDTVVSLLDQNRREAEGMILENCVYLEIIKSLVAYQGKEWRGSAKKLLEEIETKIGDDPRKKRQVPQSPGALSSALRRYIPAFASIGIEIDCDGKTSGSNSKRVISIYRSRYPGEDPRTARAFTVTTDRQSEFALENLEKHSTLLDDAKKRDCFGDPNEFDAETDRCHQCPAEFDCEAALRKLLPVMEGDGDEFIH